MTFPEAFITEMDSLFETYPETGDIQAFWRSFDAPSPAGLRANGLKLSKTALRNCLLETLSAIRPIAEPAPFPDVPWSCDGLYLPPGFQPGQLNHYAAGLYYIQEPSAMLPAAVLNAKPGEKILDLCAAPGGKSARIAADLQGQGLLWANDISDKRTRALLRNLEMTGCINSLVTCAKPRQLAEQLPGYFDAILVDAPCSGSGMFRRDPSAMKSWMKYGPQISVPVQRDILAAAWQMLRPGGRLVFATCSFSICENEENAAWLLQAFDDARLVPLPQTEGVSQGLSLTNQTQGAARIWPHLTRGDGHFCALFEKCLHSENKPERSVSASKQKSLMPAEDWQKTVFSDFVHEQLSRAGQEKVDQWLMKGWLRQEKENLHWLPDADLPLDKIRKIKTGLFLGQTKQSGRGQARFEPSQALLLALGSDDFRYVFPAAPDDIKINAYLRGETLQWTDAAEALDYPPPSAYAAVMQQTLEGRFALGWAKQMTPPLLKNLYPQGWRRTS